MEQTPEDSSPSPSKAGLTGWRRAVANLALLALASAVTLVGAEFALRLTVAPPDAFPVVTHYDSLLGWSLIPDTAVTARTSEYRVSEWTNSLGMRGGERPLARKAGEKRILILGDSFGEGYSVNQFFSVGRVLERALDDPAVRVLDAGTRGWSTDQELLYFLKNGAAIRPDLTILMFYVNDVCSNASDKYWRGRKPRFVVQDGDLVLEGVPVPPPLEEGPGGLRRRVHDAIDESAIVQLYQRALVSLRGPASMVKPPPERAPWSRSLDVHPCLSRGWQTTELLLARLRDEVEGGGSAFLVFWVPSREAVYDTDWRRLSEKYRLDPKKWSPSEDARRLETLCGAQQLDCLIPLDEFRAAAAATDERLYYRQDPHWTGAGHRVAAKLMAEAARTRLPARDRAGSKDALRFP